MTRDDRRRVLLAATAASLPWWWFAVRNAGPWADAAAIFLPLVLVPVAATVVLAALRRSRFTTAIALSWLLFAGMTIVGPWVPHRTAAPDPALRVVAANVLGANPDMAAAASDLLEERPEVLVISEDNPELHERLAPRFAANLTSGTGGQGTGVYTDLRVTRLALPRALTDLRAVRARIEAPAGPVVLYALHLPRPWSHSEAGFQVTPTKYRRIIGEVLAAIEAEPLPVVLAGDLNLVDRTPEYRRVAHELRDAMLADWGAPTSRKWWPLLARIDHVFEERSWCATDADRFTVTGSDHRANAVSIGPCPAD